MEPEYVVIGEVVKPQGLRGEVSVKLLTDWPERFENLKFIYIQLPLQKKAADISRLKRLTIAVEYCHVQGQFASLKLKGIDSRSLAEELRGGVIEVLRADACELPPGMFYIFQIVGLNVCLEDGSVLGRVKEVMRTGSNDVYVVERDNKKSILIPAIKEVVRQIDISKGYMIIKPIPGLLELEV